MREDRIELPVSCIAMYIRLTHHMSMLSEYTVEPRRTSGGLYLHASIQRKITRMCRRWDHRELAFIYHTNLLIKLVRSNHELFRWLAYIIYIRTIV